MLIQNLDRRIEKRALHPLGFVLPVKQKTQEGCSMSAIVKVCKIHGALIKSQCRIRPAPLSSISCKQCARDAVKKHREKNKESLNAKRREYRLKNIDLIRVRDNAWKKKYYVGNKILYLQRCKKYYKENPTKYKNQRLLKNYGITIEQYEEMLKVQDYSCKMCKQAETILTYNKLKNLSVDHCHTTGQVRGLLCSKCNCLIGYAKESIELLQEAINYLKEFKYDN